MQNFLNHRFLLIPFLTCLLVLGIISKSYAQNFSVYPTEGMRGKDLTVTISSGSVTFQQGSSTVCPSNLEVTTSNVVFQQGSSTIYPTSLTTNNGEIEATIQIPSNAPIGFYDVVVGKGGSCPAYAFYGFFVNDPYINVNPSSANSGETLTVNISGAGVDFHQGSPTVCPDHLNVNTSNVIFKQGSSTIYPSAISINNGQILAQVSIPNNARGYYDVVINDPNCSISNDMAFYVSQPSLNISPSNSYNGQSLNVNISGAGVSFVQGSSTICPSQLNVTTSNIYFQQGSSTIYPSAISINNDIITAELSIPMNVSTGYYDLIVGNGEACPVSKYNAFNILNPTIQTGTNTGTPGNTLDVTITGYGVNFTQGSPTVCPNQLNVTTSNVVFQQGSYTIHPTNISYNNNQIIATLNVPQNAPLGNYNAIVGYNEECSYTGFYSLNIVNPAIHFYPESGTPNLEMTVMISGSGINFLQGSSTICPNYLNVSTSDVVLRSGTFDIHPTSMTVANSSLIMADIHIPSNAPIGIYELIIGENSGCPISNPSAFEVTGPSIVASGYFDLFSQHLNVRVIGEGVSFTQESNTDCPSVLNINTSNIYITNGKTSIHPNEVSIVGEFEIECSFTLPSMEDEFNAVVGDQSGCPYSSRLMLLLEEGITNNQKSTESIAKIYPNPSDGNQANLDIAKQGTFDITIINQFGQPIGTASVNGPGKIKFSEILLEKLNPGVYIININDGNGTQHEKLIVK